MTPRERAVEGCLALGFLAATAATMALVPWERSAAPALVAGLVALYSLASRIELEVGSGRAVPEQLVFVPMLFLLPLPLVPLCVALGFLLARLPELARGLEHPDRSVYALTDAWFSLGPVVVLAALAPGAPEASSAPAYVIAFLAQVALGGGAALVGERLARGVPLEATLRSASWSYAIDAAMSPAALLLAVAAVDTAASLLVLVPVLGVLELFARERRRRLDNLIELSRAYQRTVMLISDFVGLDDRPTADHSLSVVELVDAVADELRLPHDDLGLVPGGRQELQFAALLHDVGKVAVPKEILHKPGALAPHEIEVMRRHTVEGQRILERVGGPLRRIGSIVRSCHERWDGSGYPDGLAGEEIPLAARIVFCCDAYAAMTTDRCYRRAMSREAALREIRANAGGQFDPRVAAALARVVREGRAAEKERAGSGRPVLAPSF